MEKQTDADIVFVQECHWGLGKELETSWSTGTWHVIATVDPNNPFAGTAVFISERLVRSDSIRYQAVVAGRILHVRCDMSLCGLDLISVYQWAWNGAADKQAEGKRHKLWTALGRLTDGLPKKSTANWWRF